MFHTAIRRIFGSSRKVHHAIALSILPHQPHVSVVADVDRKVAMGVCDLREAFSLLEGGKSSLALVGNKLAIVFGQNFSSQRFQEEPPGSDVAACAVSRQIPI